MKPAATRRRTPEVTRARLLEAAFQEIYRSGFRSTDLDSVLARAGFTKGALYHHFASKEALGHAVVEEIIAAMTREKWLRPLAGAADPLRTLAGIIEATSVDPPEVEGGCPLNNLSQEMSGLDEGFRRHLAAVFDEWRGGIANALKDGQRRGLVRQDLDALDTATYLMATYEGYLSLAKNSRDPQILRSGKQHLIRFLESLRPREARTPSVHGTR